MAVKVLVCDGERQSNNKIANACLSDTKIKVVGQAYTGLETISLVMRNRPDVVVLTNQMPDMPADQIISRIMKQYPTPILFLKSVEDDDIIKNIKKMNYGIIDDIFTPMRNGYRSLSNVSITTRIHILSKLRLEKFKTQLKEGIDQSRKKTNLSSISGIDKTTFLYRPNQRAKSARVRSTSFSGSGRSSKIIVIGTSTGGPRILSQIVPNFPINLPPTIIVQHMPIGFISAFAKRLNRLSNIRVKEVSDGDSVLPGTVYLAPGGKHLELNSNNNGVPKFVLTDGAPVNFVKPAVDVTLNSVGQKYGSGTVAVILTGMGRDGRDGCKLVKENGGTVIALREEDSDVYGMNRTVIEAGLADGVFSKKDIVIGITKAIEGKL